MSTPNRSPNVYIVRNHFHLLVLLCHHLADQLTALVSNNWSSNTVTKGALLTMSAFFQELLTSRALSSTRMTNTELWASRGCWVVTCAQKSSISGPRNRNKDKKTVVIPGIIMGVLYNTGFPFQTHLRLKSRENLIAGNLFSSKPIVLQFCTEYGSHTSVLCAKFQNDWTTATHVID